MKRLPHRISLAAQTTEIVREAIAAGEWQRWLPGELELCRQLQVSRVTLRTALEALEREGVIRAGQGRRREIVGSAAPRKKAARASVVLLTPSPLHRLPSVTILWMDELRELLAAPGWLLEIHEAASAFRRNPGKALDELAARLRPSAWILYRSTAEMQQWFGQRQETALIAGSRHEGVALPSVDVDHRAGCRHAAGRLRAAGHQHLAIVRPDTSLAGDVESVAGFEEGAGAKVDSALHDGTVAGICAGVARLFARERKPTGLFVFHANHLLTVLGWLAQKGIGVPGQVSVICRDDEPFLESVLPAPARYTIGASVYAKAVARMVASLVEHTGAPPRTRRIIPAFVAGETVGSVR